ncbi:hypothetical protein N665_0541s0004 [Sinapis alba]|nr:hypothetical protein N665_0541s0004 [Sinapis alba]
MKKPPPPPPLHQQEPSYQSPPRPQPPLHQQETSYQSPPRPSPPLHEQERSQAPRRRGPVITYIPSQRIFHTPNENFKSLVQRLTGKPPTSSSPNTSAALDESPAREMHAELEKTKPRLGFVCGVENTEQSYHHQNIDNQPPNLSPGSPSLWGELCSTTSSQGHSYLPWDEDCGIPHSVNDTTTIGSDYDMFLRNVQTPFEELGGFNGVGGMGGDNLHIGDELIMPERGGVFPSDFGPDGFGQQDLVGRPSLELLPLPPDASNTLFVEGLPSNCSMREVAHIFRRFSGYKEVRLVTQDSKQRKGDPVVLCFVDFENPACAATARNALQGYQIDDEERDSNILQIEFS